MLCLLGSVVRLIYGYFYEPWNAAPDQMAWEMILEAKNFSYDQLIHYPHEGGTIIISLLSRVVKLFTHFNSLVILAFLLDFISRFIQIKIVNNVFDRKIALLFGLWTIFAAPSIIPWGTVNFGLHSLSSFFPFILLYLLSSQKSSKQYFLISGLFLGLAFWFSYSNIVLVLVFFLYQIISKVSFKIWTYSLFTFLIVLGLHITVRQYADAGFHLMHLSSSSIRGANFMLGEFDTWKRTTEILNSLANSATAYPKSIVNTKIMRYLFIILVLFGGFKFYQSYKKFTFNRSTYISSLVIVLFLFLYTLSPFYTDSDNGNYVAYRHLSYILPFASLFIILGLYTSKFKTILMSFLLIISVFSSSQLFFHKPQSNDARDISIKACGWVLGTKFGHDPKKLYSIVKNNSNSIEKVMFGIGWGMSTSLFEAQSSNQATVVNERIEQLIYLVNSFPKEYTSYILEGIEFSFSENVTPILDKEIHAKFKENLTQ